MIDKNLVRKILEKYNERRLNAEYIAEQNKQKAFNNIEYANLDKELRSLIFEKGKMKFENKDTTNVDIQIENNKIKQGQILKQIGLSFNDLQPHYTCEKCKDTGYINGVSCSCLKQEYNNAVMAQSNINLNEIPDLEHYDISIFDDEEKQKVELVVKSLKEFIKNFDTAKKRNIVLLGGTGVGKTYLSQSLAKEVMKSNHTTLFTSAFNLNTFFLSLHTSQSINKLENMKQYVDAELLIIDDLGTEPMLRNVTKEYLLLLLNERALNNKSTIITSNFSPDNIIDHYNERIFSRIFNKSYSVIINMTGKDLRLKQK